jgi:cysteine synthase
MLRKAYSNEQLHPGDTIAEASKGNTGIAFAALGLVLAHLRQHGSLLSGSA